MGAFENGSKITMIVTFLMTMVVKNQLNAMFSAIKKLQIIVHMVLVSLAIPAVAQIFFSYLLDICAFSLFPTDEIYTFLLDLPEQDAVSVNFDQVGYGTNFYILNVGDLFVIALSFPVNVIIANILLHLDSIKFKTKARNLLEPVYWEGPLALIEETYIITCISAFLGVFFYDKLDLTHYGGIFNFAVSVIMSIFCVVWPFAALFILLRNLDQIRERTPNTKLYKHLWEEVKIPRLTSNWSKFNSGYPGIMYQFYSLLRRMLLSLSVVALVKNPLWCCFVMNFTTLASMIVSGHT